MENEKNIILKYKFWIITLLLAFVIFMIFYVKNSMGTFFDIPAFFINDILNHQATDFHYYLICNDIKIRFFNNLLVSIPFNIWLLFGKHSGILSMLKAFSVSYFIVPFFLIIMNLLAAKRTKRYDIAIIALAFYFIFSIPNAIWAIKEIHITILVYFIILSYFLSKVKLGLSDFIPVSLLIIYLFESSEMTFIFGIVLFIFTNLYARKKDILNPWFNVFIGYFGIIASVYILIKIFFIKYATGSLSLIERLQEIFIASKITFGRLFDGVMIIPMFALLLIIFSVFYKKNYNVKNIGAGFLYLVFMLCVIYFKTNYLTDASIELLNYSFAVCTIFPLIILILLFDYFKIDLNKFNPSFYSNLIIITCIFGILNLSWQIHSSFSFKQSENYMKNLIESSDSYVVTIAQEDIKNKRFLDTNTCFAQIQRSILYNNGKNTKIILPADYYIDYNQFCFIDKNHTFYEPDTNYITLQNNRLPIKSKYWDLSNVAAEFEKLGMTKNINKDN